MEVLKSNMARRWKVKFIVERSFESTRERSREVSQSRVIAGKVKIIKREV